MSIRAIISSFVYGFVFGALATSVGVVYLLTIKHEAELDPSKRDEKKEEGNEGKRAKHKETDPSPEEQRMLMDAIESLQRTSGQMAHHSSSSSSSSSSAKEHHHQHHHASSEGGRHYKAASTLADFEFDFLSRTKEVKGRVKKIKQFSAFLHDLSRAYGSFAKDLLALSRSANANSTIVVSKSVSHSNSSSGGGSGGGGGGGGNSGGGGDADGDDSGDDDGEETGDSVIQSWWRSLSIYLAHISQDQDGVSLLVQDGLVVGAGKLVDELLLIEKKLFEEGKKLLAKAKESTSLYDQRVRERDRCKEKVSEGLEKEATSPGGGVISSVGFLEKSNEKRIVKLTQSEEALDESSQRMNANVENLRQLMPRVCEDYDRISSKSITELQALLLRLARHLEGGSGTGMSTYTSPILQRLQIQIAQMKSINADQHEADLLKLLEALLEQQRQLNSGILFPTDGSSPSSSSSSSFGGSGGGGGGVMLDLTLESAAAIAATMPSRLPPLPPAFAQAVGKETCVWFNALAGRIYRDIARSAFFHEWFCEKTTNQLNKGNRPSFIDAFHVTDVQFGSMPPLLCNVQWSPVSSSDRADARSFYEQDSADPDFDVACTADLVFRSGIKLTLETKVMIKYASSSIAVKLEVEIVELTGRVRFGVIRKGSFFSFLEEPHAHFKVHSELGETFKLKDVPKLSEFVVKKLRAFIRNKLVHPNCHKFRLVWPRTWWPEGTENEFPPQPVPADQKPPPESNSAPSSPSVSSTTRKQGKEGDDVNPSGAGGGGGGGGSKIQAVRAKVSSWVSNTAKRFGGNSEGGSSNSSSSNRSRNFSEDVIHQKSGAQETQSRLRNISEGGLTTEGHIDAAAGAGEKTVSSPSSPPESRPLSWGSSSSSGGDGSVAAPPTSKVDRAKDWLRSKFSKSTNKEKDASPQSESSAAATTPASEENEAKGSSSSTSFLRSLVTSRTKSPHSSPHDE